jgi:hypothetical protein
MAEAHCPEEWSEWWLYLAQGLHGRCRWRLPIVIFGMLFAGGRRTVTSWLRAAGITRGFSEYYYFIAAVGRTADALATRMFFLLQHQLPDKLRWLFAIDDTPTKRYGPKVQGAGVHHNPTPGPADAKFVYGHLWVTLAWVMRHASWGAIGLPLRALLYIRRKDIGLLPKRLKWTFQTKLQQAAMMIRWVGELARAAGKTAWVAADGAYAKRPVFKAALSAGVVLVSRLRKDAALYTVPPAPKSPDALRRGRKRKYGTRRISLCKRAGQKRGWQTIECELYGKTVTKTYKSFLATYHPAYGMIRVVIVKEDKGPEYFFCTDPAASVPEILEAFADRSAIEQDFHDVKEIWGAGQQQLRDLWANIGAYHLNLWIHSLVELWAWRRSKAAVCNRRACPWDDPKRRPSHADRRKALRRMLFESQLLAAVDQRPIPRKILTFAKRLFRLAA